MIVLYTTMSAVGPVDAGLHALFSFRGLPPTPERFVGIPGILRAAGYDGLLVDWTRIFPWTVPAEADETAAVPESAIAAFLEETQANGLFFAPFLPVFDGFEPFIAREVLGHLRLREDLPGVVDPRAVGTRKVVGDLLDDLVTLLPGVSHVVVSGAGLGQGDLGVTREELRGYMDAVETEMRGAGVSPVYLVRTDGARWQDDTASIGTEAREVALPAPRGAVPDASELVRSASVVRWYGPPPAASAAAPLGFEGGLEGMLTYPASAGRRVGAFRCAPPAEELRRSRSVAEAWRCCVDAADSAWRRVRSLRESVVAMTIARSGRFELGASGARELRRLNEDISAVDGAVERLAGLLAGLVAPGCAERVFAAVREPLLEERAVCERRLAVFSPHGGMPRG